MFTTRSPGAFTRAAAVLGALWAVAGRAAIADILHVYEGKSIQAAIGTSSHGDEIVVHPGTYFENIDFEGKAVTLRSSDGPSVTTIDGTGLRGRGVTCDTGEGPDTVIDGFTVANAGGGMRNYYSSPIVRNCIFSDNAGWDGGGMYNEGGWPTIVDCTFIGNSAQCNGGAIENNIASPVLTNCTFIENTASIGGAIDSFFHSTSTLLNCRFIGNSADDGGAIAVTSDSMMLINCLFTGNAADPGYATIYSSCNLTLTNCILWDNLGGAIEGAAAVTYSDVQGGSGAPWFGEGCIDSDPLFLDPAGGDYHLSPGSPCIDAGQNGDLPIDAGDFDGDGNICELFPVDSVGLPRFADDPAAPDIGCGAPVIVDMGAYEVQIPGIQVEVIFADVNGDGAVGVADLLALLAAWGSGPGCTLPDLDRDGFVDVADLLALLAAWGPC